MKQRKTVYYRCEAEVADGLEETAFRELNSFGNIRNAEIVAGAVKFEYHDLPSLLTLRSVTAVYLIAHFQIPRPKALLGHEHLTRLLALIDTARQVVGTTCYQTLHISAAGSNTPVMNRIKHELSQATGLTISENTGDLLIRLRRTHEGWDVLVRITPRPLAVREWRVSNMEGALNGPVAFAMAQLTLPKPDDVFLNLGCGSGSILIERAFCGSGTLIGCDINSTALECARKNISASAYPNSFFNLIQANMRFIPLLDKLVDAICIDLPFGQLVGSHENNTGLYPDVLSESARVAKTGARCVLLTHEVRLMEQLLAQSIEWRTIEIQKVSLRGLHPRIYVLERE